MQVLCSELDILQTENFFSQSLSKRRPRRSLSAKKWQSLKAKVPSFFLTFSLKLVIETELLHFCVLKLFFFLEYILTQFIVHRTIDYPQVIGLIKEKTVITKCVTKTLTNKNGQTFVEMVKKMYFFTQAANSKKANILSASQKMFCISLIDKNCNSDCSRFYWTPGQFG